MCSATVATHGESSVGRTLCAYHREGTSVIYDSKVLKSPIIPVPVAFEFSASFDTSDELCLLRRGRDTSFDGVNIISVELSLSSLMSNLSGLIHSLGDRSLGVTFGYTMALSRENIVVRTDQVIDKDVSSPKTFSGNTSSTSLKGAKEVFAPIVLIDDVTIARLAILECLVAARV